MSERPSFRRDCQLTGLFYLGLAITGGVGFMALRPLLYVEGEPAGTVANLVAKASLTRVRIALELALATFQALASIWFWRLFRGVDSFAAGAVAAFGMFNAMAVLASAAMLDAAFDVALGSTGVATEASQLLFVISDHLWRAGGIFFGLWLIPMGWLCWRERFGPRALGWILILGGVGYVVNTFFTVLVPGAGMTVLLLPIVATVGEFWMIGLLLWKGLRRQADPLPRSI